MRQLPDTVIAHSPFRSNFSGCSCMREVHVFRWDRPGNRRGRRSQTADKLGRRLDRIPAS